MQYSFTCASCAEGQKPILKTENVPVCVYVRARVLALAWSSGPAVKG
jgi:hypothetical protein